MDHRFFKIAISGGPMAGKTTVLEAIKEAFPITTFVPEAATLLMEGGFPKPGVHLEYDATWQFHFQRAVVALQYTLEDTWGMVAKKLRSPFLVCDRGLLDGVAYTGSREHFCSTYDVDHDEALARYDGMIHLETLAAFRPDLFGKANNETRYETSPERAVELDKAILDAWSQHPRRLVITGERSKEEQAAKVVAFLQEMLLAGR